MAAARNTRKIVAAFNVPILLIGRNPRGRERRKIGAGEGNRTLVISLEGCCSTIELHPPYSTSFSARYRAWPLLHRRSGSEALVALLLGHFSSLRGGGWLCHPLALTGEKWWKGLDSNQRRHSQQIYSLPPLATRAPLQNQRHKSIACAAALLTKPPT